MAPFSSSSYVFAHLDTDREEGKALLRDYEGEPSLKAAMSEMAFEASWQTARAQASALHETFAVLTSWIAAAVCAGQHAAGRLERPTHHTFAHHSPCPPKPPLLCSAVPLC